VLQCVDARICVLCCSVLQRVAACCSVLQRVAMCCNVLLHEYVREHYPRALALSQYSRLLAMSQYSWHNRLALLYKSPWALCCSVLQRVAMCCCTNMCVSTTLDYLQCPNILDYKSPWALCCSVLQLVAMCCSVVQCVAVCCSVLQ